jgi:hypothetical protein
MKARRLTAGKPKTVAGLRRNDRPARAESEVGPGVSLARIVSLSGDGQIGVELAKRRGAVTPVRLGLPLDRRALAALALRRQPVLLMAPTAGDDDARPWLIAVEHDVAAGEALRATALVDGQRVELRGEEEIVLRCGEASLTLRRDGRIVVRGTYVETRSKGVNRIKGGIVQIN